MAIALSGTNQGMTRTTSLHDYNAAYTVGFWWFHTASGVNDNVWAQSSGSDTNVDDWRVSSGDLWGIRARAGGTGNYVDDSYSPATSTWFYGGIVRSSVTNLTAYLFDAGGAEVSSPTATQSVTGRTASNELNIGHKRLSNDWTGRVHCIKIWTAALTSAELVREMWRVRPVRFANLVSWTPTINAATATRDIFGGLSWTNDGTPTDAAPPPISWGMPATQVGVTITVAAGGAHVYPMRKIRRNTLLRM